MRLHKQDVKMLMQLTQFIKERQDDTSITLNVEYIRIAHSGVKNLIELLAWLISEGKITYDDRKGTFRLA